MGFGRSTIFQLRFTGCIAFLVAVFPFFGHSQNFPVRINPTLAPPFTPYLTDLTAPGSEKLLVPITLTDPTVSDYHCKLRLTIEGINISITTNPNYAPPPLILQGGVPEVLYGSDLADYLRYQNLVFKGISQADLEKSGGKLPEGIYRFTLEVLDYNRGTVVSNPGTAMAWMILNDPPLINAPLPDSKITPLNPQNVVFQWTPRHRGSPNAAFSTEYAIKLVEIWPAGRNPYDAIATSRPILEATTDQTLFVYDISETPLVIGREYALQIQALDTEGRDLFRNNGYSEVVKFTYGDACPIPTQLTADEISTAGARIRWVGSGRNSGYRLRYREKNERAEWFEEETAISYFTAGSMKTGATYEYEVCGVCDFYESEFSATQTFTTRVVSPTAFVCGAPDVPRTPGVATPAPNLFINDTIKAAGYPVLISRIEGVNGTFTGEGLATVPWFNSSKIRVTFKAIRVNQNHELLAGVIESVWNPNSPFLLDDPKTLDETGISQLQVTVATFEADTIIALPGSIIIVQTDTEGDIVVQTNNGSVTIQKKEGKTYAITDQTGNGYLVDKDGKVTKTTAAEATQAANRGERTYNNDPNKSLRFVAVDDNTYYGFDEQRQGTVATNYQQTDNGKYVAWKALAVGEIDAVQAVTEGNVSETKLKFKLEGVAPQDLTASSDLRMNLRGQAEGTIEELLAYYAENDTAKTPPILAKLNLASYAPLQLNLVLVNVNNATPLAGETVHTELNKIFGQAVVRWNSVQTKSLSISSVNTNDLEDGSSGLLSNYTADMRTIINTYLDGAQPATDTYYIFLVASAHDKQKRGFMPRKKQAGFVFTGAHANETDLITTIAHELGHGAFRLEHTFSEYPQLTQNTTDNLMDYGGGTRLNKYQWDYIHDPVPVVGLFEDDDEGAWVTQVAQCITAAAIDMAMNYTFKWVELNFLDADASNNYSLLDFRNIWAATDKWEMFSSAAISCGTSMIPWPTDKAKLIGIATASFGAGTVALVSDVGQQYDALSASFSFQDKIPLINWEQAFKKAGAQALIAGVSTGVVLYAVDHPRFRNFATKIKNLSYESVEYILKKSGFSTETIDAFCMRFGVVRGIRSNASKLVGKIKDTYNDLVGLGYKPLDDGVDIIFRDAGNTTVYKISADLLNVKIPYGNGWATQSSSKAALDYLDLVSRSRKVYRLGTLGRSQAGEAQFWSVENPFDYQNIWEYADKYGIPHANLLGDNVFFEIGEIPNTLPFITREAPGVGTNVGGAIEVVIPEKSVRLEAFNTVKFERP